MTRPGRAVIDLRALRNNYRKVRHLHGGRALAVLKANAYGHGAVACANALAPIADGFAVAFLAEALQLRQAGIRNPILVLEGCFTQEELREAQHGNMWTVVHHEEQLRAVEMLRSRGPRMNVWLKLDTGMRRAGFPIEQTREAFRRLEACEGVSSITLMSHFARADEPRDWATKLQIDQFDKATAGLAAEHSLANSAGVLHWPRSRRDWARPGIVLYGLDPVPGNSLALEPVMTLESEVFAVRELKAGEAIGYGAHYIADVPRRIGLVAMGYADGYPRMVPNGTPVRVGDHLCDLVGRVSMDMLSVDLTLAPSAGIGTRVELWGRHISVSDVASAVGTIDYELLCHVQRVDRVYLHADDALAPEIIGAQNAACLN